MLVVLDALLGLLLLGVIAALSSRRRRERPQVMRVLGWALVLGPLPLAVALHVGRAVSESTDQLLFVTGIAAFALGAAIVLGTDDEDWREESDGSPPWWPEFEREFRSYARRDGSKPRPTALV